MSETRKDAARPSIATTEDSCTCEEATTLGQRFLLAATIRTLRWADWPPDVSTRPLGSVWEGDPELDSHIRDCLISLAQWSEFDDVVEVFDRLRSMDDAPPAPDCPEHGSGHQVH